MTKPNYDKLILSPIPLSTIIGILPNEKKTPQLLLLHITLYVDTHPAAHSDQIEDAVDYATLLDRIKKKAEETTLNLIETLAEKIAQWILEDPRIKQTKIKIDKPQAFNASPTVSIEILRKN